MALHFFGGGALFFVRALLSRGIPTKWYSDSKMNLRNELKIKQNQSVCATFPCPGAVGVVYYI